MADSQQASPAQAQPGRIMKCCQKTDIRDCDCLKPQGSCQKPTNIFTHYDRQCTCYSCEWIREATQQYVPDRLGSGSDPSGTIENCTYAGKQLNEVINTENSQVPNEIELVHSVMVAQGPPQKWRWVFRSTKQLQLPYLADEHQCPKTVQSNTLYRDYGYSPSYSPYEHSADVPRPCDKLACTPAPMVPPNKLRGHSANDSNSTLLIGNIDRSVSNEDLQGLFECYGQIRYLNRPDQTCAFIQFALRRDAMMAMRQLQGVPINTNRFRITWGDPKVRNPDEFEAREGPLRLKGNRHQKPRQPRVKGKDRQNFKIEQPQYPFQYPRQAQVCQGPSGGDLVWPNAPPHGQVPAQQQMGCGYPPPGFDGLQRIDEEAETESEQTKPRSRLNSQSAVSKLEQKGKGPSTLVCSEGVDNPPQGTRTPSPDSQKTSGGSSPNSSNQATTGSSTSGRTSPEGKADPEEGGSKRGGSV